MFINVYGRKKVLELELNEMNIVNVNIEARQKIKMYTIWYVDLPMVEMYVS